MTEWDAKAYNERNTLQKWVADQHLAGVHLDGTERVLDVGCGDGKITAEIARRLTRGSVLGIDPSTRMIAFATARFAGPDHPNLAFAVADATAMPYRGEFDLVVSFNALHWVRDQAATLRCIGAALRPTGRTFLEFVPDGPRRSLEDVIEETCHAQRWARYFVGHTPPYVHFTPAQYRRLASDHGLRVERLDRRLMTWDFGSRQGFVDWAEVTFVEWTKNIPEAERLAFIDDALDRYGRLDGVAPDDVRVFRFYQMAAVLCPASARTPGARKAEL
jgi:trans-aconitate 2-methyltransferase